MTKTAVYLRQSLDRDGTAAAVERQRDACEALARAKGLENFDFYTDNDLSASSGKARPAFEKLIADMASGDVSAVVVFHIDRLTRSIRDLMRVIEAGERHRVNIACVHGVSLDLGDPTGVAVATILTAIAQMEVKHKGERQKAANRQRAQRGAAFWTRRPFGFDRDENGVVYIVPEEAQAIREGVAAVLGGATLASVAKAWNDGGFRTSAIGKETGEGGLWGVTQVRRALLNPKTYGRLIYKGDDLGPGQWPAILTADVFAELEQHLTDPRRRTAPDDLNAKYLLSGIAVCGKCGNSMFASPMKQKGRSWMVYRCFGGYCLARRLDLVDKVVESVLIARLSQPDAAATLSPSVEVAPLRQKATDLRDRRDALAALLADGLLSPAAVRQQSGRLSTELAAIEAELARATMEDPIAGLIGADDVPERWQATPVADRRKIVRTLMDVAILPAGKGVRFDPSQVKIDWKA